MIGSYRDILVFDHKIMFTIPNLFNKFIGFFLARKNVFDKVLFFYMRNLSGLLRQLRIENHVTSSLFMWRHMVKPHNFLFKQFRDIFKSIILRTYTKSFLGQLSSWTDKDIIFYPPILSDIIRRNIKKNFYLWTYIFKLYQQKVTKKLIHYLL